MGELSVSPEYCRAIMHRALGVTSKHPAAWRNCFKPESGGEEQACELLLKRGHMAKVDDYFAVTRTGAGDIRVVLPDKLDPLQPDTFVGGATLGAELSERELFLMRFVYRQTTRHIMAELAGKLPPGAVSKYSQSKADAEFGEWMESRMPGSGLPVHIGLATTCDGMIAAEKQAKSAA